jgi:hypothetical protein
MAARPDSVPVTVTCPVWLIITGTDVVATVWSPSSSSTATVRLAWGTIAASSVHCT